MRKSLLVASLCLAFAPSLAGAAGGITVRDPWFRYLLPQIPAGGFMTLHNASPQPAVLIGVRSPACGMATLHKSVNKSGVDMMVGVKSITVPANGVFRFSPGKYHIMCMQPKMKVGDIVPVTLMFKAALSETVNFKVYGADGPKSKP